MDGVESSEETGKDKQLKQTPCVLLCHLFANAIVYIYIYSQNQAVGKDFAADRIQKRPKEHNCSGYDRILASSCGSLAWKQVDIK